MNDPYDLEAILRQPDVRELRGPALDESFHPAPVALGPVSLDEARGPKWDRMKATALTLKDLADRLKAAVARQDEDAVKLALNFFMTAQVSLLVALGKRQAAEKLQRAASTIAREVGLAAESIGQVERMTAELVEAYSLEEAAVEEAARDITVGGDDYWTVGNKAAYGLFAGRAYKTGKIAIVDPEHRLQGKETKLRDEIVQDIPLVSGWRKQINNANTLGYRVRKAVAGLHSVRVKVTSTRDGWEVQVTPTPEKLDTAIGAELPSDFKPDRLKTR